MLLAAVSRMPRGRPLLEQARRDPHPAVSAWASGPPPRKETDLRELANRYLDLLALAEEKLREDADKDLKRVKRPPLGKREKQRRRRIETTQEGEDDVGEEEEFEEEDEFEDEDEELDDEKQRRRRIETMQEGEEEESGTTQEGEDDVGEEEEEEEDEDEEEPDDEKQRRRRIETMQDRMDDRALARSVQRKRERVAQRFAREGAEALRTGRLAPDLTDRVFVAYVGLLREEETWPFYHAASAIVGLGERAVPALEEMVTRPNHDARKVLRLLFAVRRDRGRGFYARFGRFRPEVERTMVVLAPAVLEGGELVAFLERAAEVEDATVRSAALDGLLALASPAGREVARRLFDPARFGGRTEFKRAALLMARAGDLELLEQYAAVDIPVDESERSKQLLRLRSATMTALRETEGPAIAALGERLLAGGTTQARALGIDLLRDPQELLAVARAEENEGLAKAAVRQALEQGAPPREALAVLALRDMDVPHAVLQGLRKRGEIAVLIELAGSADEDGRRAALHAFAALDTLDKEHEAALLKLHVEAPENLKRAALAALLPLGTEAVRRRCEENPLESLPSLRGRATAGQVIAFRFPLRRFLAGADADRLKTLARVAEALPDPEPGFYADLLEAWDALAAGERMATEGRIDDGAAQQKVQLLEALARSQDRASAARLFEEVVTGKQKDPLLALGTLKAAARLVAPEQLARLLPILRKLVKGEYALDRKRPPPYNDFRAKVLHGGINALAYARVEAALDDLCAFVLDPGLHLPAFDWKHQSHVPWWSLQALRHLPKDKVDAAFRRALREAENDGRLAALHPRPLFTFVTYCRGNRARGRWLAEVALALCEVLERLPWEGDEVTYQHAVALGQLKRYAEAAATARAGAVRKRERGYTAADGFYTPAFLEGRALIWEHVAARDAARFGAVLPRLGGDPFLLNLAGWALRFDLQDLDLAAQAQAEALRRTAGLWHHARDTLAAIRLGQNRPALALDLLDPQQRLPVERTPTSRWFRLFRAQAYRMLGDDLSARHELEQAVAEDRRILPYARALPEFQEFAEVFRQVDEGFFDALFFP
jgi:hypothetical protein